MMKNILFICLILLSRITIAQDISPINSFDDVEEKLLHVNKETLVVFDVDEVLILAEDSFLHPDSHPYFSKRVNDLFSCVKSPEEKKHIENLLSLGFIQPKRFVIESTIVSVIDTLQKKGVKVIALTHSPRGSFGLVESLEEWRIHQLKELGIDFSCSFPSLFELEITKVSAKNERYPLFKKGILFSVGYSKGDVLKAFLKEIKYKPKKVIFFDDKKEHVETVVKAMKEENIVCEGFQYNGAKRYFKPVDEALNQIIFDHLIKKGNWLTETEAQQLKESS